MPRKEVKGLVCGKFYPLHKGHDYLIRTAQKHCDHLTIMVVQQPGQQPPGKIRERWLKHAYPKARIILVDDIYKDGDHRVWAEFTAKTLGYAPDIVFSSEKYGEPWSEAMGSKHMLVDPERQHVPVSASEIRRHPRANQEFMSPEVRAYYLG
ncbi:MAG TPA: adenylyltransferase/cytidyltransferase family protein [Candidatus Saccharimonadales bacterium]|nr:adenylyltransferase/cytidyltransferase family protein [Candidatus Saccharimonadales bacterium]